ncbi:MULTISPECIES: alpha/beta hydrolase [unclassified Arthrobacter]|uniref:alpha/beta hydrolase n=1 Tax=unclassified Arthrobacter TaxID=235627 RepID=UPI00288ABC07|nr:MULTISPECIES: alpha/beta hydrolase [unclassified Arthrobacter]
MGIAFDDGAADALITAANSADEVLRAEGGFLYGAVEQAVQDFNGGYGRLFKDACAIRSDDRGKLSGVLAALAEDVGEAKHRAQQEKARQKNMEAWQQRDNIRKQHLLSGNIAEASATVATMILDPMPESTPVPAPAVSAVFSPRDRPRFAGGPGTGTTSADPEKLRGFASVSRTATNTLNSHFVAVRNAWSSFTASCSWVTIETESFVAGFERLLAANAADADWIEQVATAFKTAGSGSIADRMLNGVFIQYAAPNQVGLNDIAGLNAAQLTTWLTVPANKARLQGLLQNQEYNPAVTAAWWTSLGHTVDNGTGKVTLGETQQLLINTFPSIIGNLQGVSYTARNQANQLVLTQMLKEFDVFVHETAVGRHPIAPPWINTPGYLDRLRSIKTALETGQHGVAKQLISLNLDQPGAAISVGDLDAAKVTTYQVPGVDTTVAKSMPDLALAADTQYHQQLRVAQLNDTHAGTPPRLAVVGWVAFEPAPAAGVFDDANARTGGSFLSKDINTLAAVQNSLGNTASNNISGLSYGTLTAQAAAVEGMAVDSINLNADIGALKGVAGVQDFHLNPGADVYQTKFTVDNVSDIGNVSRERIQGFHYQTNQAPQGGPSFTVPVPAYGAIQIGADGVGTDAGSLTPLSTENHGWLEDGEKLGYASLNTESSFNQAYVSLGLTDKLTNSGEPVENHE